MCTITAAREFICIGIFAISFVCLPTVLEAQFDRIHSNAGHSTNARDSIDVVLAIDRSMSMSDENKIENAKIAASTFVGFLRTGDAIGVVSFNQMARTDFPLQMITAEKVKTDAYLAINPMAPGGFTSIGAALQLGQIELDKANQNHTNAMLLLSDGRENVQPYVVDILPSIPEKTDIHTIGLGIEADGELLNRIASSTNGTYIYVLSSIELQHIYVLLQGRVAGLQTISSFADTLFPGETQFHPIAVDSLTSQVLFSVNFQHGDLDLELIAPDGNSIDPQIATANANINYFETTTFDYYDIAAPQAGEWQLKISGNYSHSHELYTAIVLAFSGLQINLYLDQDEYDAGNPVLITSNLQEMNQPVLKASVLAEVRFPTKSLNEIHNISSKNSADELNEMNTSASERIDIGSSFDSLDELETCFDVSSIMLFDDGFHNDGMAKDGVYANYFHNTIKDGSYTFTVHASGESPQGGAFNRQNALSTFVKPSTAPAVVHVSPDSVRQGEKLSLKISGANFEDGAELSFSDTGIQVLSVVVTKSDEINADIEIAWDAAPGFKDVYVDNRNGQQCLGPYLLYIAEIPRHFVLFQNYPNPFNPSTVIDYNLPEANNVRLSVYNILGQRVRRLVEGEQSAGFKSILFDGYDDNGVQLPAGVYFYQLITPTFRQVKKLLLLR